jgi:ubiquinone/menaquinone biosynthesis C-methylase UbiE
LDIVEALSTIPGGRVLDVACGDGDFIDTLMTVLVSVESFVGIDVDVEDLEKARARFEDQRFELLEMDAAALDFEDAAFDTVCMANSMHHLERLDTVLSEMRRVLRDDGTMIVLEMFSDGEQTEAQGTDISKHHMEARIDSLEGTFHRETLTRDEIREAMDRLGLRQVQAFETSRPIRCLECESREQCEDPLDPESVSDALDELVDDLERIDALPPDVQKDLRYEAEALKRTVERTGVSPASSLLIMGRK